MKPVLQKYAHIIYEGSHSEFGTMKLVVHRLDTCELCQLVNLSKEFCMFCEMKCQSKFRLVK
jgi:hypothetical protein